MGPICIVCAVCGGAIREEPDHGLAVAKNAMFEKQQGKKDGYFLVMECGENQ